MALTEAQIQAAVAVQEAAAQDPAQHVRVVAGPGTGKSSTIEKRIRWLLGNGVLPGAICVVSFTRASALDLKQRVHAYCLLRGHAAAAEVRVSTLHSLALRTLRAAGMLAGYPVDPLVMDSWELENIFDCEFGHKSGLLKLRREEVRREHEAFWSTGNWQPANYVPPAPPITAAERAQFGTFHGPRTQSYSCVLPGEIVRKCVEQFTAGVLNAVQLLGLEHLIVDEYQDLNPMDLEFVDAVAAQGACVFVAGDDDQSIYSFRFASPAGIQGFPQKYPNCGLRALIECFRCTPNILTAAQALIGQFASLNRIPKHHVSLYATAAPPVAGKAHWWRFGSAATEAVAIAESCRDLIAAGIGARDILLLVNNQRALLPSLRAAFEAAGVAFEPPAAAGYRDTQSGRLVYALTRLVCNADDYVAHRTLLGLRNGVGIGTASGITDAVIQNNLNYRSVFYQMPPNGVFNPRMITALGHARALCAQVQGWQSGDSIDAHAPDLTAVVTAMLGQVEAQKWQQYVAVLPVGMTLEELRNYMTADTDEQQALLLQAVFQRLDLQLPPQGAIPDRVRVMTMHGAKGLSAKVVFIPGLEEQLLPGPWRQPYPGLVLEAARLLYVSVTRARAACIMSYAQTRLVNGQFQQSTPSRFVPHLGGVFAGRIGGLSPAEVQQVIATVAQL